MLKLKGSLKKIETHKDTARIANNAANREQTIFKNTLFSYLSENGGKEIDGVAIDGTEYAYRAVSSEDIDPREWHRLFKEGRISDNQYFAALSVSVTAARKGVGTDQIEDITVKTLSKTKSLRTKVLEKDAAAEDGAILTFDEPVIKTKDQLRKQHKPYAGTGVEAPTTVSSKKKRVIRVKG